MTRYNEYGRSRTIIRRSGPSIFGQKRIHCEFCKIRKSLEKKDLKSLFYDLKKLNFCHLNN